MHRRATFFRISASQMPRTSISRFLLAALSIASPLTLGSGFASICRLDHCALITGFPLTQLGTVSTAILTSASATSFNPILALAVWPVSDDLFSPLMKKLLSLTLVSLLVLPIAARGQGTLKIGTVDMNRTFREYNKTKDAEAKINDAKNQAKKEFDERADTYKKSLDDVNNLNKQLESPALSADKKASLAKDRDDKISSIKNMEREITEFRQTRERQLQEQALRMREGIVKEITDVVMEKVKTGNLDLVFDKSGNSLNGVPVLMYSRDSVDFTNDVIAALNKPGRASSVTLPSISPAAATSATPKKP